MRDSEPGCLNEFPRAIKLASIPCHEFLELQESDNVHHVSSDLLPSNLQELIVQSLY